MACRGQARRGESGPARRCDDRRVNAIRVRTPVVIGGRSAGAGSACRFAKQLGAVGCVALAFPLHPPGRPDRSRLPELLGVGLPTVVIQGERDTFGRPGDFPETVDVVAVPDADHGFAVPRSAAMSQADTLALIVEAVLEWADRARRLDRRGRNARAVSSVQRWHDKRRRATRERNVEGPDGDRRAGRRLRLPVMNRFA